MARARTGCFSVAIRSAGILVFFGILFAAGLGYFLWRALNTPFSSAQEPVLFEVQKGWNSGTILDHLREEGVLRDDFVPLAYLKILRRGDSLKAGVYEFDGPMSPIAVIDKLVAGEVTFRSVFIREGIDRFAVGEAMAAAGFGSVDEWKEITSQPDLIRDLAPDAESLEGYLFPDTYKLTPGTPPARIASVMVQNFRDKFGEQLAYISTGLSLHETVTLASIVETEARLPEERPVIAGVYLNRIRKGMLLGADPTVIYALKLDGTWDGNIRRDDLVNNDSPYNTYRKRGLPPGPIANPGLASLEASARPAASDYYYFVSRNDGSHVFARSLNEHNRNVQEFQRDYFRDKRAEEKASPPGEAEAQ